MKRFYMVKLKGTDKYLRTGYRGSRDRLWTNNPVSAKAYPKLVNARLAVANAVSTYEMKYKEMEIEEYESTLKAVLPSSMKVS